MGRAEDTRWHLRRNGERFWANGMTMRIVGADPPALLKILRDETLAKRAEEQRVLLLNELNHRIKNTLSIIQSITEQTLRAVNVDPASRAILTERLLALSQAHNVLTDENWAGADLETITRQALEVHVGGRKDSVRLEGPPVRLSLHQAVAVALALHELATNAVKYGALSDDLGAVVVGWNLAHDGLGQRHVTLLWKEQGGPPVAEPPRQGFGTRLITRSFGEQSGGQARITYAPEGVECVLELMLSDDGASRGAARRRYDAVHEGTSVASLARRLRRDGQRRSARCSLRRPKRDDRRHPMDETGAGSSVEAVGALAAVAGQRLHHRLLQGDVLLCAAVLTGKSRGARPALAFGQINPAHRKLQCDLDLAIGLSRRFSAFKTLERLTKEAAAKGAAAPKANRWNSRAISTLSS